MIAKNNQVPALESKRNLFYCIGLVTSLSLTLLAFEWKQYEDKKVFEFNELIIEHYEDEIIPIVQVKKPILPPPIIDTELPPKIVDEKEEEKFKPENKETKPPPDNAAVIPTYPDDPVEDDIPHIIVEEMPIFPGCEEKNDDNLAVQQCFNNRLFEYIIKNTVYPEMMKEAGIEGTIHLRFVINKKGEVDDIEVLRGVSGGQMLEEEAIRVIESLPDMKPGKQQGKPVKVQYNVPVKFNLFD